jgi:integrase
MKLRYLARGIKGTLDAYILLRYNHSSEQIDFSPGVKCKAVNFQKEKQESPIRKQEEDSILKNEILRQFKQSISEVIFQIQSRGNIPTVRLVSDEFHKKKKAVTLKTNVESSKDTYSLLYVIHKYVKFIQLGDKNKNRSTKYRLGIVEEFIKNKYSLEFGTDEIDEEFFKLLLNYLIKRKLSNTTSVKVVQTLKQSLNWAKRKKLISELNVEFKHNLNISYKQINVLTLEQIQELFEFNEFDYIQESDGLFLNKYPLCYKHYLKDWRNNNFIIKVPVNKTIRGKDNLALRDNKYRILGSEPTEKIICFTVYEVIKDMFLFSCSTGIRWSDLIRLKISNYDFRKKVYPIIQRKTQKPVNIIENPLSEWIFRKYSKNRSQNDYLFPLNCNENDTTRDNYNTKANRHLKAVAKILGFKNLVLVRKVIGRNTPEDQNLPLHSTISFHMGRKTYSTIANILGIDPFSLSSAMGHTGLGMTKNYVQTYDLKLQQMYSFVNGKADLEENAEASITKNDELKNKLIELKQWFTEGLITDEIYKINIQTLINDYNKK